MVDFLFNEVLVPHSHFLWGDKVTFVNEEQRSLFRVHFLHIVYEILASEEQRITTINDLDDQICSVNYSPELFPDLEIFLIGCDLNLRILLLNLSKRSSPI
jgi:hypothetical protein